MRKSYGNTWWGKRWLQALNQIDYSNRLPRGKTYANKGAVSEIVIDASGIHAQVSGRRPYPYYVDISLPPLTAHAKAALMEIITANPMYLSQLLNRKLPPDLYEAAEAKGIKLFPTSWNDMRGDCSCPDWAVPCKHMAATLYLVANEIDKNPFLVFELRNFDLFAGLEALGYTAEGQKDIQVPTLADLMQRVSAERLLWQWDEGLFQSLDFSHLQQAGEHLWQIIEPKPAFATAADIRLVCQGLMSKASREVDRFLKAKRESLGLSELIAIEEVELILNLEGQFQKFNCYRNHDETLYSFDELDALVAWLERIPTALYPSLSISLRGVHLAYRFATQLLVKQAYLPQLLELANGAYQVRWLPPDFEKGVAELMPQLAELIDPEILLYQKEDQYWEVIPSDNPVALVSVFLNHFIYQTAEHYPFRIASKLENLFFHPISVSFTGFEEQEIPNNIQLWLHPFFLTHKAHLPIIQITDESPNQFTLNLLIENTAASEEAPIPLMRLFFDDLYREARLDILRDVAMLANHFPDLNQLVANKGMEPLYYNSESFAPVMLQIIPIIELFGIKVLMPKALQKLLKPSTSLLLEGDEGIVKATSIISLEDMLRFSWQGAIGGQTYSLQEFRKLLLKYRGIVRLNDQYVHLDEKEVQKLLEALENPPELNAQELLQAALTEEYKGSQVKLDANTRQLMDQILKSDPVKPPAGLQAQLRPYQQRGFDWLFKNTRLGFGSLIADDMGLGKTLQIITTLLKLKETGELGERKALVVVPTTLLSNWEREIEKFAPDLKTHLYHGPGRTLIPLEEADVLITSYGILRSETDKLKKIDWLIQVIDEAQNIKNPATNQSKAIKKIKAPVKIAMSGTPVENRLSEYWSIFDFTNKGYLGSLSKFKENYARPIEVERDQKSLNKFRRLTEPFILRRVKTDKSIIEDLPDKIEKNEYCYLTPRQSALYQSVIDQTMHTIEKADGINRRGLILKLITALKQICNHPSQFLKKGPVEIDYSGKCQQLFSLLPQILEQGEKLLIFTQYRAMGELIAKMIETQFGLSVPFLHGGVSRKNRDLMVQQFQEQEHNPILLLSLKAGGTGLNLTAANHVIHYDLWWNPAVEAQATDRAYRIGQEKNVFIHRFITRSTFEEKIDKLLQSKKELADLTVSSGEKWIGELDNRELAELVRLGN
ncbi:MAG: SNF2-related protein [Bacteroidota bacterium]